MNLIITIILLSFIVLIHEMGHFYFAKKAGLTVYEFSLGFGKCLWSKTYGETKYSIRLLPLGGYCKIDEAMFDFQNNTFKKFKILFGGSLFNIISAYLVLILVCLLIVPESSWLAFIAPVIIIVKFIQEFFIALGNSLFNMTTENMGSVVAIAEQTSEVIKQSQSFKDLIANILCTFCSISLSVGFLNLLPIYPLDGGNILILLIEKIRHKALKEKTKVILALCGITPIFLLSIYLIIKDIINLF